MHLPRPERGHTGDAELPSCGSVFARVKGSVGGLCAAPQLSLVHVWFLSCSGGFRSCVVRHRAIAWLG